MTDCSTNDTETLAQHTAFIATQDTAALATISRYTAATAFPVLDTDTLNDLLGQARRVDGYGRPPTDPWWFPTYNTNYAIWQGWQQKMALAVTSMDFEDGQVKMSRSQIIANCEKMVSMYARRLNSSVLTRGPQRSPIPAIPSFPVGPVILPTEYGQGNP